MFKKLLSLLILLTVLSTVGCNTGFMEKLGDITDHCEFNWGTEGRLDLSYRCE